MAWTGARRPAQRQGELEVAKEQFYALSTVRLRVYPQNVPLSTFPSSLCPANYAFSISCLVIARPWSRARSIVRPDHGVGSFAQDATSKEVACTLPIGHDPLRFGPGRAPLRPPLVNQKGPQKTVKETTSRNDFEAVGADDIRIAADTHFRDRTLPGESERRERFIRFLDTVPKGAFLVLLGDIFDFYFEYRSVAPRRFLDVFSAIARTTARGVDTRFLGGNHDYWVGDFFVRELGVRVHQKEIRIAAQGRKVVLAHGDLVMPRDFGYKALKSVIRNPAVIAVSRWIHPDLLDAIAGGVAHGSRTLFHVAQEKRARAVAEHAWNHFFARGNDAFVMGHVHFPMHETREGKEFLIVGDWIEHYTYARLSGGRLRIESFKS